MRTALVRMAAADPFARFVPSSTPALAPEPDAPTMTLQEVIAPPRGVPEMETTVPEIREAPPCSLTVTLDKSSYNAGDVHVTSTRSPSLGTAHHTDDVHPPSITPDSSRSASR